VLALLHLGHHGRPLRPAQRAAQLADTRADRDRCSRRPDARGRARRRPARAHLPRNRRIEGQLRRASTAFAELLDERFAEWGLTPAERDVAWFTIKGLSLAEIARLRQTSEGTVKAQSNAIYRKSGVSGRTQLLSLFIEDLMDENLTKAEANLLDESTGNTR
jgi:DNA-binding CsgD family transcriptional regulator